MSRRNPGSRTGMGNLEFFNLLGRDGAVARPFSAPDSLTQCCPVQRCIGRGPGQLHRLFGAVLRDVSGDDELGGGPRWGTPRVPGSFSWSCLRSPLSSPTTRRARQVRAASLGSQPTPVPTSMKTPGCCSEAGSTGRSAASAVMPRTIMRDSCPCVCSTCGSSKLHSRGRAGFFEQVEGLRKDGLD